MVYIFVAFYAEAKNIIAHYDLKRQAKQPGIGFDVFANERIRLVITGTGEINAAAAVGNIGGAYAITAADPIVNIGSCACMECEHSHNRGVFLGNKLTEEATGRTFYPDMLIKSELEECEIITVLKPVTSEEASHANTRNEAQVNVKTVYDMEAAAIYQAASLFTGPHNIHFIKVVSDSGEKIGQSTIQQVFEENNAAICRYIDDLAGAGAAENTMAVNDENTDNTAYSNISKSDMNMCEKIIADMRCSKVMGDQLRQLIKYCSLSGIDYGTVIDGFYKEGKLPCNSKRDGKVCLEELKQRLI